MSDILFPVGRLVYGSVSKPRTTDANGAPLTVKTGPNAGQPMSKYEFGVAIPKNGTTDFKQTPWGQLLAVEAQAGFPQGQSQYPAFSWKVTDGDSQTPNRNNKIPAHREGYPGNWVVHFSTALPIQIVNADGSQTITDPNAIKCGYFVEVFGNVKANGNMQNPGVYVSPQIVALAGYGDEITTTAAPDASAVGFGGGQLPPGASNQPVGGMVQPAPGAPQQPPPHQGFVNNAMQQPPAAPPAQPGPVMTPKANGVPYETFIAKGWTDEQLRQHGYVQ